jgi:ribonuclease G
MKSELFVSRRWTQTWAALREEGILAEVHLEGQEEPDQVGRIVKARVTSVLPGIQSAFVAVGLDRDAFLHASDLILPGEEPADSVAETVLEGFSQEDEGPPRRRERKGARTLPIESRLREGSEILVQIEREPLGSKGSRVTSYITLPGRRLVYLPQIPIRGISRRIQDPDERERLLPIVRNLPAPSGGFIVRTAGRGGSEESFRADASGLVDTWEAIQARAAESRSPSVVHAELALHLRLLRDATVDGFERVVFDDPVLHREAADYLGRVDPDLAARLRLHDGPRPLLEAYRLDQEIQKAIRPKVWLRSGGFVVIQQTEALVSIDVNTGRFVGKRDVEETVLRTNLEAAEEIARQLRLRDLGGIIVVDFIDMENAGSRSQVQETLERALRRDRARSKVVGLGELGLLQLTRKRSRDGLDNRMTRPCPLCAAHGRVKSVETVACEAMAEVQRLLPMLDGQTMTVRAHPDVAREIRIALQTTSSRSDTGRWPEIVVVDDPSLRPDQFDVLAI